MESNSVPLPYSDKWRLHGVSFIKPFAQTPSLNLRCLLEDPSQFSKR